MMGSFDHSDFDLYADQWWDKKGAFKLLHQINPLRTRFIEKHLPLNGKKVLDVGCGGGILSESLALRGARVLGIDLGENNIKVAREHARQKKIDSVNYSTSSAENLLKEHSKTFDVVTCLEVIEHVEQPQVMIKSCAKLLKDNGWAFFSTINKTAKALLLAKLGAEYILRWLPRGTHNFNKFIKPSKLQQMLDAEGMQITDIVGINYNPLLREFFLSSDVDVNYLICARFNRDK